MTALLIKVTVALSVSLLSVRLARRRRAAVRHALLTSGFACVLLLPIVSVVAPMITVPLPVDPRVAAIDVYTIQLFRNTADRGLLASGSQGRPMPHGERYVSLSALLISAWVAGAIVLVVSLLAGLWEMRRIRRGARHWPQLEDMARHMARAAGLKRPIDVLMHDGAGPMTCGVRRPAIILPADAADWPEGDVHRALVHELEHVRRADWVTHCLARMACAFYWFHPMMWIAWRELVFEAERACDDAVVVRADAEPYADQLVSLAQRLAARRYPQLAMANSHDLSRRVLAVLDDAQQRGRAGSRCVSSVVAGAAVLIAVLTPLNVDGRAEVLRASAQVSTPTPSRPVFEVASVRPSIQDFGMIGGDCRGSEGGGTDNSDRGGGIAAMAKAAGFAPISPGRCRFTRFTLKELIAYAYAIPPRDVERMVIGGPGWIDGDRFDVEAKSGTLVPVADMRLMLQQMLADRFKLRLHREPRELQGFALVVAAGGAKLQEATGSEPRTGMATIGGGPVTAWKTTMPMLATYLSLRLGRPVDDQTALHGIYNFTLSWTPSDDERPRFDSRNLPPEIREKLQSNSDRSGTSVFTALQEQLGLRLVSRQVSGEIIVVDAADPPSAN